MSTVTSEYRHIPVLLTECLEQLELKTHPTFLDCTLGFGGTFFFRSSEGAGREAAC